MPKVTVNPDQWYTITTTTGDTAFQNQSPREMYLTTGNPQNTKDGILLPAWQVYVVGAGLTVQAYVHEAQGFVFYDEPAPEAPPAE